MVAQPEWDRIKQERDREWGGTNRKGVSLMRGVGDALTLLQATTTQKEMEFLEGRAFTRSEIFGKLAPGLDSILAINATEANAIAGKSTLIEFGVWPVLDQLAQKFSSDVLPLYAENLEGTFDDMRQTNRILDMQEQEAFERSHTINEIRAEYYDEGPLCLDESQEKRLEEEVGVQEEQAEMNVQALAQAKPAAVPAKKPVKAKDTSEKPTKTLDPRGFLFPAQIGPATPLPGDTSKPAAPAMPPPPPMIQAEGDAVPDEQKPSGGAPAEAVKAELVAWERYAVNRFGRKSVLGFEPRALPLFQVARIHTGLKAAATLDEVRDVFARERGGDVSEMARLAAAIEAATAKL
jgi:hypothetical protein